MTDKYDRVIEFLCGGNKELFDLAFDQLMQFEGDGFVDDPSDLGGPTRAGLTLKYLTSEYPNINMTIDRLHKLSMSEIKFIYFDGWWQKYSYAKIPNETIAIKAFVMAVNIGPINAIKQIQIAINRLNDKPISVDGVIGPQTISSISKVKNEFILCAEINECFAHYYRQIIADNPAMQIYYNGWLVRAYC